MTAAARIGRFAVINSAPGLKALIRERALNAGLGERLAGIVCAPEGSIRLAADFDAGVDVLVGLANQAIETLGAEVIVVGGAPISDAARAVRERVAVPVVEGVSEAVRRALRPEPSDILPNGIAARPAKRACGITPALASLIGVSLEAASTR
jgi:Asp/Glu/hydantoin racemase